MTRPHRTRAGAHFEVERVGSDLLTVGLVLLWAFPLAWAFWATLDQQGDDLSWLQVLDTYRQVLVSTPMMRWYLNSLITAGGVTVLVLGMSAACGYAISQIDFVGRRVLWWVILASFMIPIQALIVNHFFLMHSWKLINTWLGVILPQLIAPIAVIVYKQFFDSVPAELREAAVIDGAGEWEIFLRIFLPMNWGVTSALAIVVFIGSWNTFLWPFLAVTRPELMNVTVGAISIRWSSSDLTVALLAALPMALVYLILQRRVTDAVAMSAGIKE